ncbi:MAG: hypothetical protein JJE34_09040 [Alphaproteobacteria bacterium]|nr:hypothetical protein [Alphaproteobacteria bacterium]
MSGDTKIVGLWRDKPKPDHGVMQSEAVGESVETVVETLSENLLSRDILAEDIMDADLLDASSGLTLMIRVAAIIAALVWIIFYGWFLLGAGFAPPSLANMPGIITTASIPLILIALAYLLAMRNSRSEMRRFGDAANLLRTESQKLEIRLANMREQLIAARGELAEQARLLQEFGMHSAAQMRDSANELIGQMQLAEEKSQGLEKAGSIITANLTALNDSLPHAEAQVIAVAREISASGAAALEQATLMQVELEAIASLTERAKSETLGATQVLSGQLQHLQESTRAVTGEIDDMTVMATERIDAALGRARDGVDASRKGLDAQAEALGLMIDQSRAAISAIGTDATGGFLNNVSQIETRLREIDVLLQDQTGVAGHLTEGLESGLAGLSERFATLENDGIARNQRLGDAMATLAQEAERMERALASGNVTAEGLISRSESLLLALDSSARELDETLPLALGRLDERMDKSLAILASASPDAEKLEAVTEAILGRVHEAEEMIRTQAVALKEWLASAETQLVTNRIEVEKLGNAIAGADVQAVQLADQSGPKLIDALLRVKDTAEQAAERARQALARTIPEAADALGKASQKALEDAVAHKVAAQMEQIATVAESALAAAHQATDRLMRQMLTIADTSASVERRIDDARQEAEDRDKDNFARRVAVLIEALNSTAIDVGKILSNEVADSSWAAYLKGDRGVFTRRAVKLLDGGEAREIAHHYDQDADFREYVNRYIHDFEAMLRQILATRDGSALAVTLLSSDMGKLYVALAQAIERLRG